MNDLFFLVENNEMSMIVADRTINRAEYLDISGGYKAKEVPLVLYQLESGEYFAGDEAYLFMEERGTFRSSSDLRQDSALMEIYIEQCRQKVDIIYPQYKGYRLQVIHLKTEIPECIQEYKTFYKQMIADTLGIDTGKQGVQRLFYEHKNMWLKQLITGKSIKIPLLYEGRMTVLEVSDDRIDSLRDSLLHELKQWIGNAVEKEIRIAEEVIRMATLFNIEVEAKDWLSWCLHEQDYVQENGNGWSRIDDGAAQAHAEHTTHIVRDRTQRIEWNIHKPITWIVMDGIRTVEILDIEEKEMFTCLFPKALHGYLVTMEATVDKHHIISEVTYEFRKL